MDSSKKQVGYFRRLGLALMGHDLPASVEPRQAVPAAAGDEVQASLRSRIAALELDLSERDRRIAAMQAEYAGLAAERERARGGAGEEALLGLFKKLAPTLSNLAAMAGWLDQGKQVEVRDLARLGRELEKILAKHGLERVGAPGERVAFDLAMHQRMSGGSVREGAEVTVQMPGYRVGQRVVLKAMVSGRED